MRMPPAIGRLSFLSAPATSYRWIGQIFIALSKPGFRQIQSFTAWQRQANATEGFI